MKEALPTKVSPPSYKTRSMQDIKNASKGETNPHVQKGTPKPKDKKFEPHTRELTASRKPVNRRNSSRYPFTPVITLAGRWLQEAGFEAYDLVEVKVSKGKVTILRKEVQND